MTSQATLLGIRNSGGRAPAPGGNESLGWRPGRSQGQSELTCCAPYSRPLITGSVPWALPLLSLDKRKGCGPQQLRPALVPGVKDGASAAGRSYR